MSHISESIRDLLVRQGIANGLGATGDVRERKVPALSTMASSGGVKADAAGGEPHWPTTREGRVDLNSGKGRAVNAPAKFTGLRIVVDNSRNWRTQPQRVAPLGVRQFLVLVQ